MFNKVLCLLLLVHTNIQFCLSADLPEVETPLGKIRGVWMTAMGGRTFASFEGIPYAKPPIGELRFEAPEAIEPWSEVLDATQARTCFQIGLDSKQIEGEEDCLYINVYVPDGIDLQKNYHVMVHIHGGAFGLGSGRMMVDPSYLLDKDYIVVSINYRLGALGFLTTEDAAIPGNNGMKDQVLALRWVQDNIASFGGNPESVTITGISAGAASVHLHYFSPTSEGLFARGMSQSGTALDPWTIQVNPLETTTRLAELVDCAVASTDELKQCLKEKPGTVFLEVLGQLANDDVSYGVPFGPVVEKESANPFLDKDPYVILQEGNVLDVPWITSTASDEGLMSSGPFYSQLEKVDADWDNMADYLLGYTHLLPASEREEVAEEIKEFYLGPDGHIDKDNFYKFTQIFTDRLFINGGELAAKLQSRANKSPVYYFVFNYRDGEYRMAQYYTGDPDAQGVGHGEDMQYFYASQFPPMTAQNDIDLRTACQEMLYSFVTTGKPSFPGVDNWFPTSDSVLVYVNITGPQNIRLQGAFHLSPVEFWDSLGL